MKFRSFLLFACMVVVPLLAMFSHRIPPSLRQTLRERLWNPLQGTVADALGGDAVAAAAPATAIAGQSLPQPQAQSQAQSQAQPQLRPLPQPMPPTPRAPAPAPAPTRLFQSIAAEKRTVELQLAELGAFAFDCAPLADNSGLHRCSCRVAADSSGQLQRVFQAADRDPVLAMKNLLGQVQSWKGRLAAALTPGDSPLPVSPGRTLRF